MDSTPTAHRRIRWKSFIRGVPVSMSTKTAWSPACASHPVEVVTREVNIQHDDCEPCELVGVAGVEGCTHVAMEATGVYWKPVWHILSDSDFTLVLANAAHVKNVPGRKTDINDATWLADLLAHGLIRASFVPESETQDMRALLRTRKQLVREKASHIQRLQKTLEDANIKLDSVVADIVGKSGRAILDALIAGESDPAKLAALAHHASRSRRPTTRGAMRKDQAPPPFYAAPAPSTDRRPRRSDRRDRSGGGRNLEPFRTGVELLTSIPGISTLSARHPIGRSAPT